MVARRGGPGLPDSASETEVLGCQFLSVARTLPDFRVDSPGLSRMAVPRATGERERGWFACSCWDFVEQTYVVTALGASSLGQSSHPHSLKPRW